MISRWQYVDRFIHLCRCSDYIYRFPCSLILAARLLNQFKNSNDIKPALFSSNYDETILRDSSHCLLNTMPLKIIFIALRRFAHCTRNSSFVIYFFFSNQDHLHNFTGEVRSLMIHLQLHKLFIAAYLFLLA